MSERNLRKTLIGNVVSNKMDKTITVAVVNNVKHPLYGKIVKELTNYMLMMKTMSAKSVIELK